MYLEELDKELNKQKADEPDIKPFVLLPRDKWTSTPIGATTKLMHPVTDVLFTLTEGPMCNTVDECIPALNTMLQENIAKGIPDIPYNFIVGGDGTVYEGRGWDYTPELNKTFPDTHGKSVEIAHFGPRGDPPNPDQINGSWELVLQGIRNKYIIHMPKRHSDFYYA